jgi:hypothetical protein
MQSWGLSSNPNYFPKALLLNPLVIGEPTTKSYGYTKQDDSGLALRLRVHLGKQNICLDLIVKRSQRTTPSSSLKVLSHGEHQQQEDGVGSYRGHSNGSSRKHSKHTH